MLLLDEPTNHFSLSSIEGLICGLQDFNGALVIVSHNRYFLSSIGCNEVVHVKDKKVKCYFATQEANEDIKKRSPFPPSEFDSLIEAII